MERTDARIGIMANNRMNLKCSCGKTFMLAKYYPSSRWYVQNMEGSWEGNFEQALSDWLEEHSACDKNDGSMWGPVHFKLEYEQEGGN